MMVLNGVMLHPAIEVLNKIKTALLTGKKLSLIRYGNGEAIAMAYGIMVSPEQVPVWIEYAGVKLPNERVRHELLEAMRTADIVGLSTDHRNWDCAPLLEKILKYFNIRPHYATDATVNWDLHRSSQFYQALQNHPTVLVGRLAHQAAPYLIQKGVNIVKTLVLNEYDDLPEVENQLLSLPHFRVALISAGIPATVLCPRLAEQKGCVALDYGHVINDLIQPGFNVTHLPKVTSEWFQKNRKK